MLVPLKPSAFKWKNPHGEGLAACVAMPKEEERWFCVLRWVSQDVCGHTVSGLDGFALSTGRWVKVCGADMETGAEPVPVCMNVPFAQPLSRESWTC